MNHGVLYVKNLAYRSDEESGQTLVEFALVLLFVILPFMFVLIDGAMTLYTQAVLANVAREGARGGSIYQMTTPPSANQTFATQVAAIDSARLTYIRQQAQQMLGPLLSFSDCTVTVGYTPATPVIGDPYRAIDTMSVTITCPRSLFFGLIGASQINLQAEATMRIEPGGVSP